MKYLVILLLLTGCGMSDFYNLFGYRRFKVGDCLIASNKEPESWQYKDPDYIVISLGKYAYRTNFFGTENWKKPVENNITFGHLWEDFYQKVPCK